MKSFIIHNGNTSISEKTINPIGLKINESIISPFNRRKIALVVPQDGQGIFVNFLIKHPPTKLLFD
jgi:hypothetical protein